MLVLYVSNYLVYEYNSINIMFVLKELFKDWTKINKMTILPLKKYLRLVLDYFCP